MFVYVCMNWYITYSVRVFVQCMKYEIIFGFVVFDQKINDKKNEKEMKQLQLFCS